jgi:mono/diheme cytochrome c family protein
MLGAKDLTDAAYQKTFTDEQAFRDLKEGLKADGKTKMQPVGDKLSDDEVKALVTFVRGLQK